MVAFCNFFPKQFLGKIKKSSLITTECHINHFNSRAISPCSTDEKNEHAQEDSLSRLLRQNHHCLPNRQLGGKTL